MRKFIVGLLFLIFMINLTFGDNIRINNPKTEKYKKDHKKLENLLLKNEMKLKLKDNTNDLFFTDQEDVYILQQLSKLTYYGNCQLVEIKNDHINVLNPKYKRSKSDFELNHISSLQKSISTTTPATNPFFLLTLPLQDLNYYSMADSVIDVVEDILWRNPKRILKSSQATPSAIKSNILDPKLIAMGNIGHGMDTAIFCNPSLNNWSETIDNNWFGAQDLSQVVFFFNSCYTFNNPLKNAILSTARTFVGGVTDLEVNGSEEIFCEWWDNVITSNQTMADALDNARSNYPFVHGTYGIGGDCGKIKELKVSGTINRDINWSHDYYEKITVTGDLTIPQQYDLEIEAGTTIEFDSNVDLIVNGRIRVYGTSSDPVILQASGSSWGGVDLVNAISTSSFDYCEIEDASTGIYLYNSSPTINNCYIHNNGNGIYMSSSSSPLIKNCTISNNSTNGIVCNGYCEPELVESSSHGNNEIANNSNDGLISSYNSDVLLGLYSYQGFGHNSIFSNSRYNINVYSSSNISARYCWWGSNPPDSSKIYGSTSDYNIANYLTSDPNVGSSLAKTNSDLIIFDPSDVDKNNPEELYRLAEYCRHNDLFNKSLSVNKDIITRFPESNYAVRSLAQVYQISKKNDLKGAKDYFLSKKDDKYVSKLKGNLLDLLILSYLDEKNYDLVESTCNEVIESFPSTENENFALYNLFMLYADVFRDKPNAQMYLSEMLLKYPQSLLTMNALQISEENIELEEDKLAKTSFENENTPTKFALNPAYPNPFNPTTTIPFSLSKQSKVDIKVYDLKGKEVWSWGNNLEYGSGNHKIVWNAIDASGNPLSTGVYFVKLIVGNQVATQKVILMK
ncbi:MAG: T9SS type A sorting domain-containing protein [Candidatus Marinimicrobia bacterium]|nr:T9SS type A sorting domain-containing protein [Candidatus Neomarinimicrobiota bacterium]